MRILKLNGAVCDRVRILQSAGDARLLDLPGKTAFLSSRRISPEDAQKCRDWAYFARNSENCIVSGFQSPIEKEVLGIILGGRARVILVLARKLWSSVPEELCEAVGTGRMLIVSPVEAARASAATAAMRNRWILANAETLVLGSLDPAGSLAKLVNCLIV